MALITALVAILALVTPYVLGWVRHPKLDIGVGGTTGEGRPWRFVHLTIYNRPLGRPWRWVERREPAMACRVRLFYFRLPEQEQVFDPILARWGATPEPLRSTTLGETVIQVVEPALIVAGEKYNLEGSDEGATVAVAVKHEGESDAYAFNGYSYYHPKWLNPAWCLPEGEFLVRAIAICGSESAPREFKLINHGTTFDKFELQPYDRK